MIGGGAETTCTHKISRNWFRNYMQFERHLKRSLDSLLIKAQNIFSEYGHAIDILQGGNGGGSTELLCSKKFSGRLKRLTMTS